MSTLPEYTFCDDVFVASPACYMKSAETLSDRSELCHGETYLAIMNSQAEFDFVEHLIFGRKFNYLL